MVLVPTTYGQDDNTTLVTLLWSEEFNYATSADIIKYWTPRLGNNNGWGNSELQIYTNNEQNLAIVDNTILEITVLEHSDNSTPPIVTYSSARIDTKGKVEVLYGTISAKIQIPDVDAGLWPAFWTLGSLNATFPAMGEIDIMEAGQGVAIDLGLANQRVISGAHWERNGSYTTNAGYRDFTNNLNDTFYVYTLDWTPFNITTYVNDDMVWTMDITNTSCPDCEEFHQPHYIVLNVAVGGYFTSSGGSGSSSSGGGSSSSGCGSSSSSSGNSSSSGCGNLRTPDDITAPLPGTMRVDWVNIYDNGFGTEVTIVDSTPVAPVPAAPVAIVTPVSTPSTNVVIPTIPISVPSPPVGIVTPTLSLTPTSESEILFPNRPIFNGGGKGSGKGKGGKGSSKKGKGKGGKGKGKGGDDDKKILEDGLSISAATTSTTQFNHVLYMVSSTTLIIAFATSLLL